MEPINKLQTKTYIINAIKKEILSGNIKAGEELVQETIAQMLGVSRMPVREALLLLEQEGFLIRLPNRHMQVAEINGDHIASVFRVLMTVEYQIIEELYHNQTDLAKMTEMAAAYLRQEEDSIQIIEKEIQFHKKLSESLNNAYLTKIHHSMLDGYYAYARNLASQGEHILTADMKAFLQCFIDSDMIGMKKTLNSYFTNVASFLIREMKG